MHNSGFTRVRVSFRTSVREDFFLLRTIAGSVIELLYEKFRPGSSDLHTDYQDLPTLPLFGLCAQIRGRLVMQWRMGAAEFGMARLSDSE